MTHAAPGATSRGAHTSNAPTAPDAAADAERQPVRQAARHIAGRLSALPRLASRAARAAGSVGGTGGGRDSAAERNAHRREAALEAAESGARTDWAHVGIFGAGIAVGALIGAGAALLLAPATGFETRTRLAYRARRTGSQVADRLDDLGDNARRGARRGAKRVSRAAIVARWAAEDALDRRRKALVER